MPSPILEPIPGVWFQIGDNLKPLLNGLIE